MEIERKFLIDWKEIDALGLPLVKQAQSWQGYLSAATPVVRIRKRDFFRRTHRLYPVHQRQGKAGTGGNRKGADSTGIFCAGGNAAHPDDP